VQSAVSLETEESDRKEEVWPVGGDTPRGSGIIRIVKYYYL